MQVVLAKEAVMDSSHSFLLSDLPIATGEKFTIIVIRDNTTVKPKNARKVFAHRILVDNITLPNRDELHER